MEPSKRGGSHGLVLVGPFLTRNQAAHRLHVSPDAVLSNPRLIRIPRGIGIGEAYPAWQFDGASVRGEIATLNPLLLRRVDDLQACSWYATGIPALRGYTPLGWLSLRGDLEALLENLPEPLVQAPGEPRTRTPWSPPAAVEAAGGYGAPWKPSRRHAAAGTG